MDRLTWFSMNWKSRQALGGRFRLQVVSPGGNGAGVAYEFFHQQGHEQLPVQPSPGALLVMLGQMAQFCERLEALENQFDLPTRAVPLEHFHSAELGHREGREHDHVLGVLEGFRLQLLALFRSLPAQALVGDPDRLLGLAERADPPRGRNARVAFLATCLIILSCFLVTDSVCASGKGEQDLAFGTSEWCLPEGDEKFPEKYKGLLHQAYRSLPEWLKHPSAFQYIAYLEVDFRVPRRGPPLPFAE